MAKKKVGSVHTCKNGAKYKIMPNGRARFISGPTGRKKKKGAGMYAKKGGVLGITRAINAGKRVMSTRRKTVRAVKGMNASKVKTGLKRGLYKAGQRIIY